MLRELLKTLGESVSDGQHPHGAGFMLHGGFVFKCAGTPGTDPETGDPITTDRHVIGALSGGPDDCFPIPNPALPNSNPEVNDSIFTLDPSVPPGFDITQGLCHCGQPITIK